MIVPRWWAEALEDLPKLTKDQMSFCFRWNIIYKLKTKEDENIYKCIFKTLNMNLGNLIEVAQKASDRKRM